jgi:hypothetical protein
MRTPMHTLGSLVFLALANAVATTLLGWWSVPIVSAFWAIVAPRRGAVLIAVLAGAGSWAGILGWSARSGPIRKVDPLLTQIMGLPERSLLVLTLAFGALLSGSAVLIVRRRLPFRSVGSAHDATSPPTGP